MPLHFFLCPNYSETEFGVICIVPHCIMDGTSVLQYLNMFSDEMDVRDDYYPFLRQKSITFLNWMFIYLTFPYYAFQCIKLWWALKNDKNCIKKQGNFISGKLKSKNASLISTGKIKALSKSKGCTINDVVLALISTSLKEYFVKHGDETGHVTLSVPFTFRSIPQNKWDYKFCNQFAGMQIRLDLEAKFDDAVKRAQKMARN